MIDTNHDLSVTRQCRLLNVTRSNLYYQPVRHGHHALYPKPRTSKPGSGAAHRIYPHLLRGLRIDHSDHV